MRPRSQSVVRAGGGGRGVASSMCLTCVPQATAHTTQRPNSREANAPRIKTLLVASRAHPGSPRQLCTAQSSARDKCWKPWTCLACTHQVGGWDRPVHLCHAHTPTAAQVPVRARCCATPSRPVRHKGGGSDEQRPTQGWPIWRGAAQARARWRQRCRVQEQVRAASSPPLHQSRGKQELTAQRRR